MAQKFYCFHNICMQAEPLQRRKVNSSDTDSRVAYSINGYVGQDVGDIWHVVICCTRCSRHSVCIWYLLQRTVMTTTSIHHLLDSAACLSGNQHRLSGFHSASEQRPIGCNIETQVK